MLHMSDVPLNYNVRWIERTFSSPSVTQSLLSPERDAGNITTNDYEAAASFFPGPTRRYCVGLLPLTHLYLYLINTLVIDNCKYYFRCCMLCSTQALVDHHSSNLSTRIWRLCHWFLHRAFHVHICTSPLCSFN